jgi:glycosyltransferase involved in cell wall biosynthesis
MSTPLVSIVTPSFNQADFLEHTIRSVLSQDYPQIEYMVIDGGSSDGSLEIIKKYADRLAWWISEPDEGQADAINKGLKRAQGEVVAWLNSDDLYWPGAVRIAIEAIARDTDLGLVYGNAISIDGDGRPFNDMVFDQYSLLDLLEFRIICQPAVFMRREILEQVDFLQSDFHYLLDHSLWLRIARVAPMLHMPRFLAFARFHPMAKNIALAAEFGTEAFRILEWARGQEDLAPLMREYEARVMAGAHRYNARYLLDGGVPRAALGEYLRALRFHAPSALEEWHRILYSALASMGLHFLSRWYYRWTRQSLPPSVREKRWYNVHQLYED